MLTAGHAACASGAGGACEAARLPELGAVHGAAEAGCGLGGAATLWPPALLLPFFPSPSFFLSLSFFSFFSSPPSLAACLYSLPRPSFLHVFFSLLI